MLEDDIYLNELTNFLKNQKHLDFQIININQLLIDLSTHKDKILLISDNIWQIFNNINREDYELEKLDTVLLCTCFNSECKKGVFSSMLNVIDCIRMDSNYSDIEKKIKNLHGELKRE